MIIKALISFSWRKIFRFEYEVQGSELNESDMTVILLFIIL